MPLIWAIPPDFPPNLVGSYVRDRSPDRFVYRKCQPVLETIGVPVFDFKATGAELGSWNVLPNDALLPLVSVGIASAIDVEAGNEVQILDAQVETFDSVIVGKWKLINVLHAVTAIDHAASQFTTVRGTKQILGFQKLRYRSGALGSLKIARDAEYKSHILVSPALAHMLNAEGARGIAFRRDEDVFIGA